MSESPNVWIVDLVIKSIHMQRKTTTVFQFTITIILLQQLSINYCSLKFPVCVCVVCLWPYVCGYVASVCKDDHLKKKGWCQSFLVTYNLCISHWPWDHRINRLTLSTVVVPSYVCSKLELQVCGTALTPPLSPGIELWSSCLYIKHFTSWVIFPAP